MRNDQQVSKMKTIYERAIQIFVWLGVDIPKNSVAFFLMRDKVTHLFQGRDIHDFTNLQAGQLEQFQKFSSVGITAVVA